MREIKHETGLFQASSTTTNIVDFPLKINFSPKTYKYSSEKDKLNTKPGISQDISSAHKPRQLNEKLAWKLAIGFSVHR